VLIIPHELHEDARIVQGSRCVLGSRCLLGSSRAGRYLLGSTFHVGAGSLFTGEDTSRLPKQGERIDEFHFSFQFTTSGDR